jgi:hypothetical protein
VTDVLIGSAGAAVLARRLDEVPVKARRRVAVGLRRSGEAVRSSAAQNASWSSRIPASLGVKVRFAGRTQGVAIVADAVAAPHARPYEGVTGSGEFRHPVFGHETVWVAQGTRPFLRPAVVSNQDVVVDAMNDAVAGAISDAGL